MDGQANTHTHTHANTLEFWGGQSESESSYLLFPFFLFFLGLSSSSGAKMLGSTSRLGLRLSQIGKVTPASRRITTSAAAFRSFAQVPKELQKKMFNFQVDNGLPVHVRGGIVDKVLMVATYIVCGLGLLDCCRVYYVLSYPAKEEKE